MCAPSPRSSSATSRARSLPPRCRFPSPTSWRARPISVVDRSRTHLVLIPSYNPGPKVYETVQGALAYWSPVWVVVDGSDDGTPAGLEKLAQSEPGLRVIVRERNCGKGAAVLHGCELAAAEGYTHAL